MINWYTPRSSYFCKTKCSALNKRSNVVRRTTVVSILAVFASCGLVGCGDAGSDNKKECDAAQKPATAISCVCNDGVWEQCTYPEGNKCEKSNCGSGTVCDSATGECVPAGGGDKECKAEDKTSEDCTCNKSSGLWENCGISELTCEDKLKTTNAKSCDCDEHTVNLINCKYNCNESDKATNAVCTCVDAVGLWANDCVYTCIANETQTADNCTCNPATGEWENCEYSCINATKPANAQCECNRITGKYDLIECTYTCTDDDMHSDSNCFCNEETGNWEECTFQCPGQAEGTPVYPKNAITNTCTCDTASGAWNCRYNTCDEASKPTAHVVSGSCICNAESKWECKYEACIADDLPPHAYHCNCVKGEWDPDSCSYNYCDDKTVLSYQKCDSATGTILFDHEPSIVVSNSGAMDSITEGNWKIISVKLSDEPANDVPLTITPSTHSRLKFEPSEITLTKSDWNKGKTITLTTVDNNAIDGDIIINVAIKANTTEAGYKDKEYKIALTIKDNDKPSINIRCEDDIVQTNWTVDDTDNLIHTYASKHDLNKGIDATNKCYVSLGQKPIGNVEVKVQGSIGKYTLPSAVINDVKAEAFESATLNFTPENYNKEQTIELVFDNKLALKATTILNTTTPATYQLVASTTASDYKAENVSTSFKVRPMPRYIGFGYKGVARDLILPAGKYRLHAWGASGGEAEKPMTLSSDGKSWKCTNHGGAGAYVHADLTLAQSDTIFVRTGGMGKANIVGTEYVAYNGGGKGRAESSDGSKGGCGGGGGTDFCMGSQCLNDDNHWPYRVLVAGGGGGCSRPAECYDPDKDGFKSGTGGSATWSEASGNGLCDGQERASGGSYYALGGKVNNSSNTNFGKGMDVCAQSRESDDQGDCYRSGGGGGGWFGGTFIGQYSDVGGGAGSSYVFIGTNKGSFGQQDAKYALTNPGGSDGGDLNMSDVKIEDGTGGISKTAFFHPSGKIRVDHGYAMIEVLYDD